MPLYRDHIYPFLVSKLGDPEPIRRVRQQIIASAQGKVLEIGIGAGANLAHYNPAKVSKLYALEPNRTMIRLSERRRKQTKLKIEFLDLAEEHIPLGDGTIDTVVSTFTLCTIPDVAEAIRGLRRVLRRSGKLIFFEHALSTDPNVRRWQKFWEPIHYWVFEGLELTRDAPSLIRQGGFEIDKMEAGYIARFPKSWTYFCWGTAIPQAH